MQPMHVGFKRTTKKGEASAERFRAIQSHTSNARFSLVSKLCMILSVMCTQLIARHVATKHGRTLLRRRTGSGGRRREGSNFGR